MKRLLIGCLFVLAVAAILVARWWAGADQQALAGLTSSQAAAVLARDFDQGFTAADGRLLHDWIIEKKYQRALDVGTAYGTSSIWFALAMRKTGGQVVTIELDPARMQRARENFREAAVSNIIESRIADALEEIPRLTGNFDFVFLDTGAPLNKRFLALLYNRISPGGTIAAHNAYSFYLNQRDFLRSIQNDLNFKTDIVPTRSGGILISTRK